jgi:UDP-N-acetylglucosamine 2-epimerase (non-hydrolysing)
MISLTLGSSLVMTDSGGLQEETTVLGIPCLTLRQNTERPITVSCGTNLVVGNRKTAILDSVRMVLDGGWRSGRIPDLWDGHTADRIVGTLAGVYS